MPRRRKSTRQVRRCSVKKLFKAIDSDDSGTITLNELKKAFVTAAGPNGRRLTYSKLRKSCLKYAGHVIGAACANADACGSNEVCDWNNEVCNDNDECASKCIAAPGIDTVQVDLTTIDGYHAE
jgi:hypothetical protein